MKFNLKRFFNLNNMAIFNMSVMFIFFIFSIIGGILYLTFLTISAFLAWLIVMHQNIELKSKQ